MVAAVNTPDPPGRIVVVDDDPTVADVVGRYLIRDGHQVECVRDGQEALKLVAEETPDPRGRAARAGRRDRPAGRLRDRRRRLLHQAVQPARAGPPGPLGAPPGP